MGNIEDKIIEAIRNKKTRQNDIAELYADLIIMEQSKNIIDWKKVNSVIRNRWSFSGVGRIKRIAREMYADHIEEAHKNIWR